MFRRNCISLFNSRAKTPSNLKHFSLRKKVTDPGPKVIVPGNFRDINPPISCPYDRNAIIFGGSNNGFGYTAAEQLLEYGARRVVLADNNEKHGKFAAMKLCKMYGRNRATFYPCDLKNSYQIDGLFKSSICLDENISIVFSDLDAIHKIPNSTFDLANRPKSSNSLRIARHSLEFMSRETGNQGASSAIIFNCASILGFMGWPDDPHPVYCNAEPAIETAMDLAEAYPEEKTGVRVVALCPSKRTIENIGLPDMPHHGDEAPCPGTCSPDPTKDRGRLGVAISQAMYEARSGSTYLIEPAFTLREQPRLIEFPDGPKVERPERCPVFFSKAYEKQPPEPVRKECLSSDRKARK